MNDRTNAEMDEDIVVFDANGVRYRLRTTSYSDRGDRPYQEDELLHDSDENFVYYAVFDGHGGWQASDFAKEHLVAHIRLQDGLLDDDPQQVAAAIRAGFADTQKAMESAADNWPKTSSGHRSTAGTTVSLVMIDRRKARMFVAHLGDSRAVLGRCDRALPPPPAPPPMATTTTTTTTEAEASAAEAEEYNNSDGSGCMTLGTRPEPLLDNRDGDAEGDADAAAAADEDDEGVDDAAAAAEVDEGVDDAAAADEDADDGDDDDDNGNYGNSNNYEFRNMWKWRPTALTVDHKPESKTERERIEKHGGSIMVKYNVPRVVWMRRNRHTDVVEQVPFLAVARSLGDLWSYNFDSGEYIVSPVPDVECIELTSDIRCLVLGSDGLFNMIRNAEAIFKVQEVENYLQYNEQRHIRSRDPSRELVTMALDRWRGIKLRSDNISVLTVAFRSSVDDWDDDNEGRNSIELGQIVDDTAHIKSETDAISDSSDLLLSPKRRKGLAHTTTSSDDENNQLRLPLNHLNQNRTCVKRSRSLDSVCAKQPRFHQMDLRGARDRAACKRASSITGESVSVTATGTPSTISSVTTTTTATTTTTTTVAAATTRTAAATAVQTEP